MEEALQEVTMEAQVMAHPLMKKALQSRETAISQGQETRQISNSKRCISQIGNCHVGRSHDLEAQAIKSILDRYAFFGFVSLQEESEKFLKRNGVIQPFLIKQTLMYEMKMYYLVVPQ